jgi:predicted RNA-binding Zn ribbon-like protein
MVSDAAVVDPASFVRARALRTLLRELGKRNSRGAEPEAALREEFTAVTAELRVRFVLDERGVLRVEAPDDTVDGALGAILAVVHQSQVAGTWRRLKSCPGPHCGWLFYDGSRNASSRWCSMSICGNRTKTAAYRRRRKDGS